jgi:secreted Zn-dependent insulinase-like peptidase
MNGLHIIVQSGNKDPTYLDQRVEDFLVTFRGRLEQLSITDVETNVKAVVEKLLEKPKNLNEVRNYGWITFEEKTSVQ